MKKAKNNRLVHIAGGALQGVYVTGPDLYRNRFGLDVTLIDEDNLKADGMTSEAIEQKLKRELVPYFEPPIR